MTLHIVPFALAMYASCLLVAALTTEFPRGASLLPWYELLKVVALIALVFWGAATFTFAMLWLALLRPILTVVWP